MRWPWQKKDTELDLEVRYHVETLADGYERQGMTRAEALRKARAEFGGVEKIKDECRDESRWASLLQTGQDLRFGWRMMKKTPAVTIAAVATLALGIGATTAILTLADAVMWRTLAVPAPDQLTELFWWSKVRAEGLVRGSSGSMFPDGDVRVADFFSTDGFQAMREAAAPKGMIAGHVNSTQVSTSYAGTVTVSRMRGVTGDFFPLLQVQPFAGRLLSPSDEGAEATPAVVVTHRFWASHLGESADAIGKTMTINNRAFVIAGVLPKDFTGIAVGEATDLYLTLGNHPDILERDGWYRRAQTESTSWWIQLLARRKPGVTVEEFQAAIEPAFVASWPARPKSAEATPHLRLAEAARGLGNLRREWGNPMWMLLGLVGMVLLIACANIANLLLARAVEREKEAALRVSLGCGERRLMRQFFTESALLAAIGGVLSIGVAVGLGMLMRNVMPGNVEGLAFGAVTDPRALAGAAAITLLTVLLFGVYPAWRTARVNASPALKEGAGSGGTLSRSRSMPAKILVLTQVALGVLLVTAALIFTARLNELVSRETGFERAHTVMFDVRPGEIGYDKARLQQFYVEVETRLSGLAGIESVGLSGTRPMRGGGYWDDVQLAGQDKRVSSAIHHSTASFIGTLGVPMLAGRIPTPQESQSGAKVAVVDESIDKQLGGNEPLGMRVKVGDGEFEVIGVAKTARYDRVSNVVSVVYLPFSYERKSATVLVRTSLPPMAALGSIRAAMKELNRDLPLVDVFTMEQQISRTLQRERLFAWLCGSFGVLALVLCAVGLYGLMSHTTARRTGEIGIRMALGATRGNVMGSVMWDGLRLAAAGLVLGVPLAVYAADLAVKQSILPAGPIPYWTLATAVAVLAASAVVAVFSPALRASSIDPMQALRQG